MKQYLLAVHMVEDEAPAPEEIEQAYKDVEAFNEELRAAGAWVFAGGLHPADTATVVRVDHGEVVDHRRPLRRDQGAARRVLDHPGRRSRRCAGLGGQGRRRLQGSRRGAALPGGP